MREPLNNAGLDLIFRDARSHNGWKPEQITEAQLRQIYELMKLGPTSANCSPARILFLVSQEAKEKLKPAMNPNNVEKVMTAPAVAIIGYDTQFYEFLPELFPHRETKSWFDNNPVVAEETAFRNGSLQGAYFIIAARALGLDTGPMSGFNASKVNALFWPDGRVKVNFICGVGSGDESKIYGRSPRFSFERVCKIL